MGMVMHAVIFQSFFIPPFIHLILLLLCFPSAFTTYREESMTWVMAKMNRMTKHQQQATERKVIDVFTQHKMDVVYSVSRRFSKALLNLQMDNTKNSHTHWNQSRAKKSIQQIAGTLNDIVENFLADWPWSSRSSFFAKLFHTQNYFWRVREKCI